MQEPQWMQSSIFFISACMGSDSQFADGARRSMSDILAHWLIMIPFGHGIQ
jgi:hypothetical protein